MDPILVISIILAIFVGLYIKSQNDKEKDTNEKIKENLRQYETLLFMGLNLNGWTKILEPKIFRKIKHHNFFEGISFKSYSYVRNVNNYQVRIKYYGGDELWKSKATVGNTDIGNAHFIIAQGDTLQECINSANKKLENKSFKTEEIRVKQRSAINEELERIYEENKEDIDRRNMDIRPYNFMMKALIKIDKHINDTDPSQLRDEIIEDFKTYLGLKK